MASHTELRMNALQVVEKLVGLVLDLVPHMVAQDILTKEAIKRQNAIADSAEAIKFGPPDHEED
jgi:hypothetical protein